MGSEERIASARRVAALESVQPPSGRRGRATGLTPSNPRGAPSVSAAPRVLAGLMSAPFPWAKRRAFDAARADVARISFRGLRPAGRRRRRGGTSARGQAADSGSGSGSEGSPRSG